ncbi:MAG TPA: phosphoadenosine phosphosulfate reductase family protein [Gemmataceae bacterium]|nr:phosphoadenosine phosphosulfate reductase family protein [Gemmataceae bacterium]
MVSTSGGKDSQTMLRRVVAAAEVAGVKDRIVAVHADMGQVEWPGVPELAAEQAAHYGVRFEIVIRPQGDLLQHVLDRSATLRARTEAKPPVPSPTNRYCTSDHKRDQIAKVLTSLTRAEPGKAVMPWMKPSQRFCTSDHKRDQQAKLLTRLTNETGKRRRVRILQCMGMRAAESPARAKLRPFYLDKRTSNGRKTVHIWLPIHGMTEAQVWADVHSSGVRHHWAYDLGMPRLSCCFCIYAPKAALVLAAKHMPELAKKYAEVEEKVGYLFRQGLPMADVIRAAESGEDCGPITTWEM